VYLSADPPDLDKARRAYLTHLERHPNDLVVMNNLACLLVMPGLSYSPLEALSYSQRAYDQMRAAGLNEPLLLDTHGWVLVNAGRVEEGIGVLQSALDRQPFVDVLYHLGEAHLRLTPPRPREAERFLAQAQQMVVERAQTLHPVDPKMQKEIETKLELSRQLQQSEPSAAVSGESVAN